MHLVGDAADGLVAGGLVALVAGTALVGGALRGLYLWWDDAYPATALQPVQAAVEVVTDLVVTLLLPRHRSTRAWAVALVLPMWWLADRLIAVALYGTGILG